MIDIEQQRLFETDDDFQVATANIYPNDIDVSLIDKVKPRQRYKVVQKARDYVWTTALLFRIIQMKVELISSGFKIRHEDEKVQKFYEDIYRELDIDTFIQNFAWEYEVCGEIYPFYSWKGNKPEVVTLLDPELVEVKSVLGKSLIYLKPSPEIQKILSSDEEGAKRLRKFIPRKYAEKWQRGEAVLLDEDASGRYLNIKAYHEQYAHSPIEPIFADLEILHTLQEADYRTARKLRQLILQVKVGHEKLNGGKPVSKNILEQAKSLWTNPSMNMEIFTQWFLEANYISPNMEIFNNTKYESVVKRILDWSGMNVMFEESGSFSLGYIKVKGLKQSVLNARNEIKKALDKLNREIARKNGLTYYGKLKLPKIYFSNNALEDSKEINAIVQYLYNMGTLSIDDLLEHYGYDSSVQIRKKKDENGKLIDKDVIRPIFESNQGLLSEEDTEQPETDNQQSTQPRPSTK